MNTEIDTDHDLERFEKSLNRFEQKFNCELQPTGHTQDGEIFAKEFWALGLIEAPDCLDFKVGGWIEMLEDGSIHLNFSLTADGSDDPRWLRAHYEEGEWSELRAGDH
jgi:hypothetical protein